MKVQLKLNFQKITKEPIVKNESTANTNISGPISLEKEKVFISLIDEDVKHEQPCVKQSYDDSPPPKQLSEISDIASAHHVASITPTPTTNSITPSTTTTTEDNSEPGQLEVESDDVTDFERVRLENIRRNQNFLLSLGIMETSAGLKRTVSETKSAPPKRSKKTVPEIPPELIPLRRSSRTTKSTVSLSESNIAKHDDNIEETAVPEEIVESYNDSDIAKYTITTSQVTPSGVLGDANQLSLVDEEPILPTSIPAIYSMGFHPTHSGLLLCGGKSGLIELHALHDIDNGSQMRAETLFAFQGHGRWISGCKFVFDHVNDMSVPQLIVSASDDGAVKLWDISKKTQTSMKPKQVLSCSNVHGKGIFALDYTSGFHLLTGSKDKSVCLSTMTSHGDAISVVRRFDELHYGVVKTVCWQSLSSKDIFASGSQDRSVCVKDTRSSSSTPDIAIEEAHRGGVFSVSWGPTGSCQQHLLLTAGCDGVLRVFDTRKVSNDSTAPSALYELHGHCSPVAKKFSTIMAPKFVSDSSIISTGENSDYLSIFNLPEVPSANAILPMTKGRLPERPLTFAHCAERRVLMVATHGGQGLYALRLGQ